MAASQFPSSLRSSFSLAVLALAGAILLSPTIGRVSAQSQKVGDKKTDSERLKNLEDWKAKQEASRAEFENGYQEKIRKLSTKLDDANKTLTAQIQAKSKKRLAEIEVLQRQVTPLTTNKDRIALEVSGGEHDGIHGISDKATGIYGQSSTGSAGLFDGNVTVNGEFNINHQPGAGLIFHLDPLTKKMALTGSMQITNSNAVGLPALFLQSTGHAAIEAYTQDYSATIYAHNTTGYALDALSDAGIGLHATSRTGNAARFDGDVQMNGDIKVFPNHKIYLDPNGADGNIYFDGQQTLLIVGPGPVANPHRHVSIHTEGGELTVASDIIANGIRLPSDSRFKRGIVTLTNSLATIRALRGVNFLWDTSWFPALGFPAGRQTGFIAQEVADVLPDLVTIDRGGFYSVYYESMIPILVEAIKEQQT